MPKRTRWLRSAVTLAALLVPDSLARVLGPQSNAIDADNTIWSFFATHGV